jgi:hypothetical protein
VVVAISITQAVRIYRYREGFGVALGIAIGGAFVLTFGTQYGPHFGPPSIQRLWPGWLVGALVMVIAVLIVKLKKE